MHKKRSGNNRLLDWRANVRYHGGEVMEMESKDVLLELRKKHGMTQEELAERLFVTRQAVSRWEAGETTPNVDTLKLLSRLFDVSINTLLGSPRKLVCQCCGMPLEDGCMSRETDGSINEEYCQWCYAGGEFVYQSVEELVDYLAAHMSNEQWPPEQARAYFESMIPRLKHWSREEPADERVAGER